MPKGPSPGWSRRTEPIMDDHVWASINHDGGKYDPDTGHYPHLFITGIESRSRADLLENNLYNAGRYFHRRKLADIGVKSYIKKQPDGTYNIEYFAVNKAHTYKYIIETYGEDRSKWPYNPRAKNFG